MQESPLRGAREKLLYEDRVSCLNSINLIKLEKYQSNKNQISFESLKRLTEEYPEDIR